MQPSLARIVLLVVTVIGLLAGLIFMGASHQFESNLGVGLFVIGGVSGVSYLSLMAGGGNKPPE
jgi:hypothetical protein